MKAKELIEILQQYPDFEVSIIEGKVVYDGDKAHVSYNPLSFELADVGFSDSEFVFEVEEMERWEIKSGWRNN